MRRPKGWGPIRFKREPSIKGASIRLNTFPLKRHLIRADPPTFALCIPTQRYLPICWFFSPPVVNSPPVTWPYYAVVHEIAPPPMPLYWNAVMHLCGYKRIRSFRRGSWWWNYTYNQGVFFPPLGIGQFEGEGQKKWTVIADVVENAMVRMTTALNDGFIKN